MFVYALDCATCGFCGAGPNGPVATFDSEEDALAEGSAHAQATGHIVTVLEFAPEDDYPEPTEEVDLGEPVEVYNPDADIDTECRNFAQHLDGLLTFAPHEFWKRLVLA